MANFIDFEKVIIHNFGSYGHAELDLKSKGFCLVSGKNNFKKDNALSNGSGKSFIWSAICYTITGETLNGLHTNLKNINIEDDNKCYVKLLFKVNADEYEKYINCINNYYKLNGNIAEKISDESEEEVAKKYNLEKKFH